ncbi:nitroreductase [Streptomyces sp. NPDC048057]|uniref:nitroreductase n=1 Tax=Streptomyces sp. NPDC048057 TaxID=3155628 RepID=UPI0033F268BE
MDVMTAILTRRSEDLLAEPAPADDEFVYLLRGAATAPDRGDHRAAPKPWRWILLRGEGHAALARCLGPGDVGEPAGAVPPQAPLIAALVFAPQPGDRAPQWEQLAAATTVSHSLTLLLHARGYGSVWYAGRLAVSAAARALLALAPTERLLGGLWIGTPDPNRRHLRRPLEDVAQQVSVFGTSERSAAERV